MNRSRKRILHLAVFVIITNVIFLTYLYKFRAIPAISNQNVMSAKVVHLESGNEKVLKKAVAQELADRLSDPIPKSGESEYWSHFQDVEDSGRAEYLVDFYDEKGRLRYSYEISLDDPKYAKQLIGQAMFWQKKLHPISDYDFEEILN